MKPPRVYISRIASEVGSTERVYIVRVYHTKALRDIAFSSTPRRSDATEFTPEEAARLIAAKPAWDHAEVHPVPHQRKNL